MAIIKQIIIRSFGRKWSPVYLFFFSEQGCLYTTHSLMTSGLIVQFMANLHLWATSLVAQRVRSLPAVQETWVRSLGREDPLEKEMATHSGNLAWRIPWTEEQSQTRLSHFISLHFHLWTSYWHGNSISLIELGYSFGMKWRLVGNNHTVTTDFLRKSLRKFWFLL